MSGAQRGRYVALEGIEGAGKSSVAAALANRLSDAGIPVLRVREPGGTAASEQIRRILLDPDSHLAAWTEALLFAAARAQLATDVVLPALAAGTWVVSDRSVYSSLAYQGGGRGLGVAAVRAVNAPGLGDAWPDLVVVLQVDPALGLARQEVADRIGAEGIEFQRVVATAFDDLASAEPDRVVVIEAAGGLDEVVDLVHKEVSSRW